MDHQSTIAVIPAYNEELTVAEVVRGVRDELNMPVVVVDDCSTDRTAQLAAEGGATVLSLRLNLGAWSATQAGLRYALSRGYEFVVTLDADGQHDPAFIPQLLRPVLDGHVDVIIGSCRDRGSWMRKLAWSYFNTITGLSYADLTSGFRGYSKSAIDVLLSDQATLFDYQDMGVLLLLEKERIRIGEIQLCMRERKHGKSRIFITWWHVFMYMLHSSTIGVAKRRNKSP